MKKLTIISFVLLSMPVLPALAQDDPYAADREALLVVLGDIEAALNARDLAGALKHLDDEVVITYYDATVTRGPDEAAAYYKRMMEGAGAVLTEYSTKATVGAPAVFHGDTAIAYGTTNDSYVLARGLEFDLEGHWSTTLQKQDGQWVVVALHFSSNLFDNPLLNSANRLNRIFGIAGFALGLLVMWIIGRFRRKSAAA